MKLIFLIFIFLINQNIYSQKIAKIDVSDISKELLDEIQKIDSTKKNDQSDIIRLEGVENTKLIKTKLDSAKYFARLVALGLKKNKEQD